MVSSVGVSQGEKGSPMESPPTLMGDISPPSQEVGGSKRLLGTPEKDERRRMIIKNIYIYILMEFAPALLTPIGLGLGIGFGLG